MEWQGPPNGEWHLLRMEGEGMFRTGWVRRHLRGTFFGGILYLFTEADVGT